jgi:hypothetical protein
MINDTEINNAILDYRSAKDKLESNLKRINKLKLLTQREQKKTTDLNLKVKEAESWLLHRIEITKLDI